MRSVFLFALALPTLAAAVDLTSSELAQFPTGATSYTYAGEGLAVSSTGPLNNFVGEPYTGLWIGQGGGFVNPQVTFTLDAPTQSLVFKFNAMGYSESFHSFAVNGGTPTFSLTNTDGTSFDGSAISSTVSDGKGTFTITSDAPFTNLTFLHSDSGANNAQNGSIIRTVTSAPVPEPASMAVLGLGLAALRRRRK